MDVARHDADLAGPRRDHARAVGADKPGGRAFQGAFDAHHVQDRNALGDAHHQFHACVDGFQNAVSSKGRRHIDGGCIGPGRRARLVHGVENRQVQMRLPALAGGHAADHFGAIGDGLLRMKGALAAGEALADNACVFVYEYGHLADVPLNLAGR